MFMLCNSFRCWIVTVSLLMPLVLIGYIGYFANGSPVQQAAPPGPRSVSTLKLIAVVSRHGNRAPFVSFPNDPYPVNDTKHWPYGSQELTRFGRQQMYKLGVRLRGLYNGFLKPAYFASDVYAMSTRVNRTIQSGLCLLAGLYPPKGFQVWNKAIHWQPIQLFTDSPDKMAVFRKCPRYQQDEEVALQNFMEQYSKNISAIGGRIAPYVPYGHNITSMELSIVWDALTCENNEGFLLPVWTEEMLSQPVLDLISQLFIADAMVRLIIGTFFDNLVEIFYRKMNGTLTPDRQLFYFSGHDMSLVTLQAVLGIPPEDLVSIVHPASAMVFELHQHPTSGVYIIQVLYIDGQSEAEPRVMNIGGCGCSCELNQLIHLTTRFCDVDFDAECQSLE